MQLVVVYLWKESDNLPQGHSAMKIEDGVTSEFFSWWPSKDGRATPPSYGPKSTSPRLPKPGARNMERQLTDLRQMTQNNKPDEQQVFPVFSDKVMLQSGDMPKHASFKFFFREGLDVKAAKMYWEDLLAGDTAYSSLSFNCHMPVAQALIKAFESHVQLNGKRVADPTAKKLIKARPDGLLVPETTNSKAWSVAKLARLCSYMAKTIDDNPLTAESKVIIRKNHFENNQISKLDYGPQNADFSIVLSTGKLHFTTQGAHGVVNPRMSSLHHAAELKTDAEHFSSAFGPVA